MDKKIISIVSQVDVAGALASGSLSENLYMLDNNRHNGSSGEGSEKLATRVNKGEQLLWTTVSLEPEAYASITKILIDPEYCEPELKRYEGSDVTYWLGEVKKDLERVPYKLEIKLGTQTESMAAPASPSLVGC